MSGTLFLIVVLAVFGGFMAALLWAQLTTPSLADYEAMSGMKSGPRHE